MSQSSADPSSLMPALPSSLTRRAAMSVVAGVFGTALSACGMTTLKTQNFRITVEDDQGHVLGSGVWQWQERVPVVALEEFYGWDGEAFPILHPVMGRMYVTLSSSSGWGGGGGWSILRAYQSAGLIQKFETPSARLGAEGFRQIARMKSRIELPPSAGKCVVQFADETDPRSVRVVMTYSRETR
jgi:hypothetical protein